MASSTTPPKDDPISSLFLSDTFYTWFTKTDTLIDKVNPIEVYSITSDMVFGRDGITISADGDGNHTIGYILPATIPGGHTFQGGIDFQGAITGNLVNQYNGLTGNVIGVSSISGTGPIGNSGLVEGVLLQINGVTGTSFGHMTLDGKDIPNTVGSLTGGVGYILNSGGGTGFTFAAAFFTTAVTGGQIGLRVDPVNNQVGINTATVDSGGKKLRIDGGKSGGILLNKSESSESDIHFASTSVMTSNSTFNFKADTNAANSGAGTGLSNTATHFTFSRDGSSTVLTIDGNGNMVVGGSSSRFINTSAGGGIGVASGSIIFKSSGASKLGVNANGALLAGGSDAGDANQTLISQGSGSASKWSTRFIISSSSPSGSGDQGAVWYQV